MDSVLNSTLIRLNAGEFKGITADIIEEGFIEPSDLDYDVEEFITKSYEISKTDEEFEIYIHHNNADIKHISKLQLDDVYLLLDNEEFQIISTYKDQ